MNGSEILPTKCEPVTLLSKENSYCIATNWKKKECVLMIFLIRKWLSWYNIEMSGKRFSHGNHELILITATYYVLDSDQWYQNEMYQLYSKLYKSLWMKYTVFFFNLSLFAVANEENS